MNSAARIAENLAAVRGRIAAAAQRSGRCETDVLLVAVTKYVGLPEIRALVAAGCHQLAESRPQALWQRADELADGADLPPPPVAWHLVGHLQRNKVRRTLPLVRLIQSVDSPRLLAAINTEARELQRVCDVLLEVNVAGEAAKTGLAADELPGVLRQTAELSHVRVCGLMAMARLQGTPDEVRGDFSRLRALRDRLEPNCPPACSLKELSMGMSGDFEVAIEEGATIVRIGSALFEGLST